MPVWQCGAGISTSAGIPDFRSPDTGLYAQLSKLDLPYPEAVFDISFFRDNPLPFYKLAHELYPGNYKPTLSHFFLRLLSEKGLLLKVFTQNIDCLERKAGVPEDKIVEAHGSFAHHRCIECKTAYPDDMMKEAVQNCEVPYCLGPHCNGLVKPDIVFFGEQLPEEFHLNKTLPAAADLCIIMGTSLTVHPFASLPGYCAEGVPRVLINLDRVGSLGSRADDVLLLMDCDSGVRNFAAVLGWAEELEALRTESNSIEVKKEPAPTSESFKDEFLNYQIGELTREVEMSLEITAKHEALIRKQLKEEKVKSTLDNEPADKPNSVIDKSGKEVAAPVDSRLSIDKVPRPSAICPSESLPDKTEESETFPGNERRRFFLIDLFHANYHNVDLLKNSWANATSSSSNRLCDWSQHSYIWN